MDFNDKVDEFRKWISKLDDDDFSHVMSEVQGQCRIRGNLGRAGPLYSCAMWMTIDLNKLNDTNPGVTSDLIGFARSWPTTLSAHKGTRREEMSSLNKNLFGKLGQATGLNYTSRKQFHKESPSNQVALRMYDSIMQMKEAYLGGMTQNEYDQIYRWLDRIGGSAKLIWIESEELQGRAAALPKLSSNTHGEWAKFCWIWGKNETNDNILKWKPLEPLLKAHKPSIKTPTFVRSLLAKGFKAIAGGS